MQRSSAVLYGAVLVQAVATYVCYAVCERAWGGGVLLCWACGGVLLLVVVPLVHVRRGKDPSMVAFVLNRSRVHLLCMSCLVVSPVRGDVAGKLAVLGGIVCAVRLCLQTVYGYTRKSMFKMLNTGHNLEVLQLEKYLLYATGEIPFGALSSNTTLEGFYRRGPPKVLPLLEIFSKWKRTESTEGSVYEEYGYDLGESLRIPNRPRFTPEMEELDGAISVASLVREFTPPQANELFSLISYGERSRIRYSTFSETFRQISLERSNLYHAVKDCRKLLSHFYKFLLAIEVLVVFMAVCEALNWRNAFLNMIMCAGFLHVFIPGSTSFFESFLFLMVSHPYDNGDRVFIKGENMLVKKVGLFSTCFCSWSGTYIVMQNNTISKLPIKNIRRAISQYWTVVVPISLECSNAAILKLKKRLQWYVQEEKMLSGLIFAPEGISSGNCVTIKLLIRKNSNFQNGFFTLVNYTKCLACIIRIITEEGLYYKPPIVRTKVTDTFLEEAIKVDKQFPQKIK
ncbi:hypothetical protein NECID01_0206 [Nematocida sp. AWRm77]|nr:hypothetical protein NECID01_0206 [Nematocida sp. AWRm77]